MKFNCQPNWRLGGCREMRAAKRVPGEEFAKSNNKANWLAYSKQKVAVSVQCAVIQLLALLLIYAAFAEGSSPNVS